MYKLLRSVRVAIGALSKQAAKYNYHYVKRNFRLHRQCINKFWNIPTMILGNSVISGAKINVEDDLRKAIHEGDNALIKLMDELRDLVINVSKEYRSCLSKQVEIIKKTGDEASGELPQYRTLATELSNELNEYVILLKTIGDVVYDQAVISWMLDQNSIQAILTKYTELEILLLHEFEENKRKELELLEVNIAKILSR